MYVQPATQVLASLAILNTCKKLECDTVEKSNGTECGRFYTNSALGFHAV